MNPYFEQMILSATPLELVRLLYRRAISSVRDAREHLAAGRIAERSVSINRAYEALLALVHSLRREEAPELAARLLGLYDYMQRRLLAANLEQSDPPLLEVLGLLSTLEEAWNGIEDAADQPVPAVGPWPNHDGEPEWRHQMAVTA